MATTTPLPRPSPLPATPESVASGTRVPALDLLKIMSADQWEDFVLEWADSLLTEYQMVERCGGAGDLGRDVVAVVDDSGVWDNYQCKHYDHPLHPSDLWTELGKLCIYTWRTDFTVPRAP